MDRRIRTAVVGFGKMGLLHGALVNIREDMELVAICEKTKFTRNAFKSVMGNIVFYSDFKKMINREDLDALIITTPTFLHTEAALYAAQKNLAVFCEKPLALTGEEACACAAVFAEKGIPSLVGFSNRYYPTIAKGKELLEQGEIGELREIKSEMYIGDVFKRNSGWRYDPKLSGGGALIDFGIHMIDLLDWYFGKVTAVKAYTRQLYSERVEDEAGGELYLENGLCVSFKTSWSKPEYRKASPILRIMGVDGEMTVTEQTLELKKNGMVQRWTHPDLYQGTYADIAGINYSLEMEAFVKEIRGEKSGVDMHQAAKIQNVVSAMYRSAKTGEKVEVRHII